MSLNLLIFFLPIIFLILVSRNTIDDNLMWRKNLDFKEIIINFKGGFMLYTKNSRFY